MGLEEELSLRFHKLTMYGEGDFFLPHMDNVHSDGQTMTLIVEVPDGTFTGKSEEMNGGFLVVDGKLINRIYSRQDILLFHDVVHEVTKVEKTPRVALIFDVVRGSHVPASTETEEKFIRGLEKIRDRGQLRVGFLASFLGFASDGTLSPSVLKEVDLIMHKAMDSLSHKVEIVEVSFNGPDVYRKEVQSFLLEDGTPSFQDINDYVDDRTESSDEEMTIYPERRDWDDYDNMRLNKLEHPSIVSSRFKLGGVLFLASSRNSAKTHQGAPVYLGDWNFRASSIYRGLAVIAHLKGKRLP